MSDLNNVTDANRTKLPYLRMPPGLTESQKATWWRTVRTAEPGHFEERHLSLLLRYCSAVELVEQLEAWRDKQIADFGLAGLYTVNPDNQVTRPHYLVTKLEKTVAEIAMLASRLSILPSTPRNTEERKRKRHQQAVMDAEAETGLLAGTGNQDDTLLN